MHDFSSTTPDLSTAIEKHETNRPRKREKAAETTDLSLASLHFQLLLAGTFVFFVGLFWLTDSPVMAIQVVGCYMAFVSVVLGHKVLTSGTEGSRPEL